MKPVTILQRGWKITENILFVGIFFYILWYLVTGFGIYVWDTFHGGGFIKTFSTHLSDKEYYNCVLAVVMTFVSFFYLLEMGRLFAEVIRKEKERKWDYEKAKIIFHEVVRNYKLTFMASFFGEQLSKIMVIDIFWRILPYFQKLSFFTIGFEWYYWVYAYLVWELTTWLWHYSTHRVRLLWCLHSPHHAPEELNMTGAWVHFFAEGFYTAVLQLTLLMLLGVQPKMLVTIMAIEVSWGTFIHAGERSLKKGRLWILQHLIITPSHHRVHHAKNPLYIDTNFCTFLPFWDWLFGTLQPLRDEVKIQYGITRKMETGSFMDFYFGEFAALFRDISNTSGWKNKLLYLIKPPGWQPGSDEQLAARLRSDFLQQHPELGYTTRALLFGKKHYSVQAANRTQDEM